MKKIKILNLYAGIGGNRLHWDDVADIKVTAVEYDEAIAEAYQSRFPNDKVVVGDAKQYLLEHYKEFDFIWASPPCQTHSQIRLCGVRKGDFKAVYNDLSLYEMILFLQTYYKLGATWVVENVLPFYTPLIKPTVQIDRHLYWSNFIIEPIEVSKDKIHCSVSTKDLDKIIGTDHNIHNKVQVVRNQVNYETGKYILECALDKVQHKQGGLF